MSGPHHAEIVKTRGPDADPRDTDRWCLSSHRSLTPHQHRTLRSRMRRAPSAVLLSVLVPLGVVVPVASVPHASAHPVAPEVRSQPLHGVQSVGAASLRGSSRATFAAAGRPEVLVTRTGLASFDLLGVTWKAGRSADLDVLARSHGRHGW